MLGLISAFHTCIHCFKSYISGFDSIPKTSSDYGLEKQSDIVHDVCKSQKKVLELAVKNATVEQSKQYLKQNKELLASYHSNISDNLNQKLEELKDSKEAELKTITDQIDKTIRDKSKAWNNDTVPLRVQEQLDELQNQHVSEINRLKKEMENQKKQIDNSLKTKLDQQTGAVDSTLQNVYDLQNDDGKKAGTQNNVGTHLPLFQRSSAFVSPRPLSGTTWNSRTIFGRTNPSPVATVLPQRKPTTDDKHTEMLNLVPHSNSEAPVDLRQPPTQLVTQNHASNIPRSRETVQQSLTIVAGRGTNSMDRQGREENCSRQDKGRESSKGKKVPKKRRKKTSFSKKKKQNMKVKTYERSSVTQETRESATNSSQSLTVYEFRDETSPTTVIRKTGTLKTSVITPANSKTYVSSAHSR